MKLHSVCQRKEKEQPATYPPVRQQQGKNKGGECCLKCDAMCISLNVDLEQECPHGRPRAQHEFDQPLQR